VKFLPTDAAGSGRPLTLKDRGIRFIAASAVSTAIGLAVVAVAYGVVGLSAVLASFVALCIGLGPTYVIYRRWVWGDRDRASAFAPHAMFWTFMIVGWVGSTGAILVVSRVCQADHLSRLNRTLAVTASSLCAYGLTTLVRYLVFDTFVFRSSDNKGSWRSQ
jgi:putative flippase GtrA